MRCHTDCGSALISSSSTKSFVSGAKWRTGTWVIGIKRHDIVQPGLQGAWTKRRWGISGIQPVGNLLGLKVLRKEERPYVGVSKLPWA